MLASCLVEVEGLQRSSRSYSLLSSVPCRGYVAAELALSDREPVLPVRVDFPVPTSPCSKSNALLNYAVLGAGG